MSTPDMSPGLVLAIFLIVYALVGAAFAFNFWGVSDRAAQAFRGKPWLIRQIGRDNPNVWRGGGFIMFICGLGYVVGLLVLDIWNPRPISTLVALAVLSPVAITSVVMLLRERCRKPHASDQPPEPPH